jgi:decaprenylphospho-beta-D-erythro-pentofuranosid-2-ulose 2-reductase
MGVLVLGATAGMIASTLHKWAQEGQKLYLVGRQTEKLHAIGSDLQIRYGTQIETYQVDVDVPGAIAAWWEQFLAQGPTFEKALIAWGYLGDEDRARRDDAEVETIIRRNYTSVVLAAGRIAAYLAERGGGVIGIISSVAGIRGRAKNYHYGSAKAALIAYASGLRAYYWEKGVRVVTILPGFVDTPMVAGLDLPRPLVTSAQRAGHLLYGAMKKSPAVAYVPGYWRWIMLVIRLLPESIFRRLRG